MFIKEKLVRTLINQGPDTQNYYIFTEEVALVTYIFIIAKSGIIRQIRYKDINTIIAYRARFTIELW